MDRTFAPCANWLPSALDCCLHPNEIGRMRRGALAALRWLRCLPQKYPISIQRTAHWAPPKNPAELFTPPGDVAATNHKSISGTHCKHKPFNCARSQTQLFSLSRIIPLGPYFDWMMKRLYLADDKFVHSLKMCQKSSYRLLQESQVRFVTDELWFMRQIHVFFFINVKHWVEMCVAYYLST